jgi:eukaryotic-like serine/threonine-protein kinase
MSDPGGPPEEPGTTTLNPGTRLGKYEIVRLLGAGGMGAVYEASHTEIGKRVAIKVLSLAVAAVPGARARFLREAQLTSRVRHPNIVDVTDMGSEEGQTYLVMEFLRGEDLSQRLNRAGALTGPDLVDIMLPVCSAVVEAHQAGITHRDLKPQNIFLAAGPHGTLPKVLDFGISKGNDLQSGTLTGTGAMIGTPFYLAPEQIMDTRSAGPQSDQYALGVIMYECLTGYRPFEAENLFVVFQAIVAGKPVPPRDRRADISLPLQEIVLRAMNVDPKVRFPSTKALGHALLPFASARVRPIWEDAFSLPPSEEVVASVTTAPGLGPTETAVASNPGGTKVMTPATPEAESWDRIKEAVGSGRHQAAARPEGLADTKDLAADSQARARRVRRIAALSGGVALGVIAAIALFSGGSDSSGGADRGRPGPAPVPAPVAARPPAAPAVTPPPAPAPAAPAVVAPPIVAAPPEVETFDVSVMVEPPSATVEFDGEVWGEGRFERTLPRDRKRHRLRFTADGYADKTVDFTDRPPPPLVRLSRLPRPAPREPVEATTANPAPAPRPPRPRPPAPETPHMLNPNGAPVID